MIETAINSIQKTSELTDNKQLAKDKSTMADAQLISEMKSEMKSEFLTIDSQPLRSPKSISPKSVSPKSLSSFTHELEMTNATIKQSNEDSSTLLLPDNQIKSGKLFGPFTDPIQWLAIRHSTTKHSLPKEFCSLEPDLLNLFRNIQMANSSEEQNMEIVVKSNKFYFRAMQTIDLEISGKDSHKDNQNKVDDSDDEVDQKKLAETGSSIDKNDKKTNQQSTIEPLNEKPLFAWFSSDLSARLPVPAMSTINGNKRFFCTKCNQVFIYPNPTILHILFACNNSPASNSISSSSNTTSSSTSPQQNDERLASPSGALDNSTSLSSSNNVMENSSKGLTNSASFISSSSTNSSHTSSSIDPTSYAQLNGSLSLANSKILKNLEAKFSKQFSSQQNNISSDLNNNASTNNTCKANTSKPTKKRAFDIDSLVNNVEQTVVSGGGGKKQKSADSDKKSSKIQNEKVFKTPQSTISISKTTDHLTNSTLINSLNSPLVNTSASMNGLANSPFLNPFSFLDPASLALNLPSAFHKVDNTAAAMNKALLNNTGTSALPDHNSLLNAAALFSNPNFANPFDLATLYAQHQRSLLQSMFGSQATNQQQTNPLSAASSNTPTASQLNYLHSQLTNPLFAASQNLNNLNCLSNFNSLNSLLAGNTPSGGSITSGLPNSLANSLFAAGQSAAAGSSLNSQFNQTNSQQLNSLTPQSTSSQMNFNASNPLLDPFIMPQATSRKSNNGQSSGQKKKKSKEKDLNVSTNSSSKSSHSATNNLSNISRNHSSSSLPSSLSLSNNNSSTSKLDSLIPPSYFQFLSPSLAALSSPQSNWCAKCNISFRMTSDLVYHMRSQHKDSTLNGSAETGSSPTKRKREENKLFCQICGEGFKERHHLTRHMISH